MERVFITPVWIGHWKRAVLGMRQNFCQGSFLQLMQLPKELNNWHLWECPSVLKGPSELTASMTPVMQLIFYERIASRVLSTGYLKYTSSALQG